MDMQTIIILGILVLIGVYLFTRNRARPTGTYRDPDYQDMGNQRPTYDDPNYRSGGSIGGQQRTNDYDLSDNDNDRLGGPMNNPSSYQGQPRTQTTNQRPRHDSKDHKSGGSIGGKR